MATSPLHDTAHDTVILVISTVPSVALAQDIAQQLVTAKLAACVNILSPCQSVYIWNNGVENDTEIPLLIKTTRAHYAQLETRLTALHPYDVPEIIALPVTTGLPDYLHWVQTTVTPSP